MSSRSNIRIFINRLRAFTLVELLIVIAVIAVISVVVLLVLNPAQLVKQSRDANRIADMDTLIHALAIYQLTNGSLGAASTSYISVPDPTATSSVGDQCQGLGLPTLPGSWSYHCASSSSFRNTDGTGWIPVNLGLVTGGTPLSKLPVDPINATSSNFYYTYTTALNAYEMTTPLESTKYGQGGSNDRTTVDGGKYSDLFERGTSLALAPLDYASSTGGGGGGSGSSTWPNGYAYRRTITATAGQVAPSGTSLTNFTMLVSGTYSYLAASSSGGNVQSGSGYDIIFTSDASGSNALAYDRETYTSSTGAVNFWVKVPTFSSTSRVLYMFYNNSSTASDQSNMSGAWDASYNSVYHMRDGTTISAADAKGAYDGSLSGVSAAAGQIGGAGNFNGSANITTSNTGGYGDFTACAWFKTSTNSVTQRIVDKSYTTGFWMGQDDSGNINNWGGGVEQAPFPYGIYVTLSSVSGNWHMICNERSGTTQTVVGDGTLSTSQTVSNSIMDGSNLYIGSSFGLGAPFTGQIDQVEISSIARSTDWIATEYYSQSVPSSFYSVGSATTAP